jgi:hypothetical protein
MPTNASSATTFTIGILYRDRASTLTTCGINHRNSYGAITTGCLHRRDVGSGLSYRNYNCVSEIAIGWDSIVDTRNCSLYGGRAGIATG